MNKEMQDLLVYFVKERENIRWKKETLNLPPPWTADPHLAKFRFCNVRRSDDRVSRWIIKNLLLPFEDAPDLWFIAACARFLNWPPSLQSLLDSNAIPRIVDDFNPKLFGECLQKRMSLNEKSWTGAYLTPSPRKGNGEKKAMWAAEEILNPLKNIKDKCREAVAAGSLQGVAKAMGGSYGWGTFLIGQVVADLSYVKPLSSASDLYTWAPIGPGSTRGLNRLFGRTPIDKKIKESQFLEELIEVQEIITSEAKLILSLHDNQSICCELDKICRLREGGRVRASYIPENRFFI